MRDSSGWPRPSTHLDPRFGDGAQLQRAAPVRPPASRRRAAAAGARGAGAECSRCRPAARAPAHGRLRASTAAAAAGADAAARHARQAGTAARTTAGRRTTPRRADDGILIRPGRQQVDAPPRRPAAASGAHSAGRRRAWRRHVARRVGPAASRNGALRPSATCSSRLPGGLRQQREHRRRVDLQRAADGLRERAGEGRVGQFVEAVGLERLELARRHLDRRGQRRDVQALRLARLRAAARRRVAPAGAGSAAVSRVVTHRTGPGRRPPPRATGKRLRNCRP